MFVCQLRVLLDYSVRIGYFTLSTYLHWVCFSSCFSAKKRIGDYSTFGDLSLWLNSTHTYRQIFDFTVQAQVTGESGSQGAGRQSAAQLHIAAAAAATTAGLDLRDTRSSRVQ